MKRIYKTKFDASHFIQSHEKCGKRHSHQYELLVSLTSDLQWLDFHTIRERVDQALALIGIVDHTENYLGHMTCEELSHKIYNAILKKTEDFQLKHVKIQLFETEHFGVEYP